jgi:nicotinamidase-related amidase
MQTEAEVPIHPTDILPSIVAKVFKRRGSLYAFPTLNPTKTALVVIDLDMGTARDAPDAQQAAKNVNMLAAVLRKHGGTVAWVTTPIQKPTENFKAVYGTAAADFERKGRPGGRAHTLWPEFVPEEVDIRTTKLGSSAFFPGKCNLHDQLKAKETESVLVVGAVTNVCCEASARDAAELDYKVTIVSDAMVGLWPELNRATFTTFFRWYGDVRITEDVIQLIGASG